MFTQSSHLELPRRITAWYMLFGLATVAWIVIGVPTAISAYVQSRAESAWLTRLGKAATAVVAAYVRDGVSGMQPQVERLHAEGSLAYCAVVAEDGRFLAHSSPERVGQA